FTLWALAGQMDVPGGLCFAGENSHFPINHDGNIAAPDGKLTVAADKFPLYSHYRGECHASGLVDAVLDGKPYPIKGLIIHGASLLTSWPETPVWKKTLSSLDFLVTIDRQLTADSAFADIVLPATTMFEIESYMTYGPIFRIREKCIEPVGEARNDYLIMAELARRLGYGHLYPQSEEELLSHVLKGSGYTPDQVRKAGGWVKLPTHMMEYKKWEKGKCRPDGEPGFDTPTGKFEIYSTVLEDYGYEPLPKYTEPTEGPLANPGLAEKFPIVFNSGARPHTDFRSQHHGIEPLVRDNPEPSMEMNTADAKARGIESGDLVKLSSPRGSVQFRAQVSDRIVQGAIEANMGGGGPIGPKAWRESNVNNLTDLQNYDEISGFPVFKALLCEVEKAEEGTAQSRAVSTRVIRSMGHRLPVAAQKQPAVRIYLDNNATTEMDQQVRDAMMPFLSTAHGNPSSIHEMGRAAREGLRNARFHLARLLNCRPRRIIFTDTGSEADNLALKGVAFAHRDRGKRIITTVVEHPAVLNCCKFLERNGYEVIYLPVDRSGRLDPEDLKKAITDGTILVSIMMVNNEVGTIFPIKELAKIAHARGVLFHTDAVQAAGKIPINVEDLDVDLLSLSGHKFHAPKGVGALFVKKGVELEPLVHGGKQEYGIRAGTENVASIVGMGRASELALDSLRRMDEVRELRDELQEKITSLLPGARLNGPSEPRIPNTINMTLPNLRGESMVIALDQKGVALSSGSACKSGSPEPSHALMAMGMSEEDAHCTVRFSLSRYTTGKEIAHTAVALEEVLEEMEAAVRFLPCK
ncbi:MAG: aminotransferase class V-fold PLP-dependent enzyme, partial [Acidobacteriota bacterium]